MHLMSPRSFCFLAGLLPSLFATGARAEKLDMSPAELRATATHVIVGKVRAIYSRQDDAASWRYTHYVAEVAVEEVEKGDGIPKGSLLYARYWTRRWIAPTPPPPSTSGHRGLPKAGQKTRIYLSRDNYDGFTNENNDGGYNVIGANGFERLADGPAFPTGKFRAKPQSSWQLEFGERDAQGQGSLTVYAMNGKPVVRGSYKVDGEQVELTDVSGEFAAKDDKLKTGSFSWSLQKNVLRFKAIADANVGRRLLLESNQWVGP